MDNCVFCKIVKGEIPCIKIYEDDNFLVFLDIHPINKGHTLIIPKQHYNNLFEIDNKEILENYFIIIKKISDVLKKVLNSDGNSIHMDNNVEQKILHSHVHIIPRFNDDKIKMMSGGTDSKWDEMEEIGEKLKKELI